MTDTSESSASATVGDTPPDELRQAVVELEERRDGLQAEVRTLEQRLARLRGEEPATASENEPTAAATPPGARTFVMRQILLLLVVFVFLLVFAAILHSRWDTPITYIVAIVLWCAMLWSHQAWPLFIQMDGDGLSYRAMAGRKQPTKIPWSEVADARLASAPGTVRLEIKRRAGSGWMQVQLGRMGQDDRKAAERALTDWVAFHANHRAEQQPEADA